MHAHIRIGVRAQINNGDAHENSRNLNRHKNVNTEYANKSWGFRSVVSESFWQITWHSACAAVV